MHKRAVALAFTLAMAGLAGLAAAPTQATEKRAPAGPGLGFVTAESRYSGQTISGPVRRGPQGRLEVRLPGGTWLECGRSCSDTLRRETVDFWQSRGGPRGAGGGQGPGYLQFKF